MTNFHVGQKVVCVDDVPMSHPNVSSEMEVTRGAIYTVRWVGMYTHPCLGENLCIRLSEVLRYHPVESDIPFKAERFRPVAEKPTSMDIIRAIVLDPSKPIPDDPREPVITPVPEYEQGAML